MVNFHAGNPGFLNTPDFFTYFALMIFAIFALFQNRKKSKISTFLGGGTPPRGAIFDPSVRDFHRILGPKRGSKGARIGKNRGSLWVFLGKWGPKTPRGPKTCPKTRFWGYPQKFPVENIGFFYHFFFENHQKRGVYPPLEGSKIRFVNRISI